jgi:hypothetical protein
VGVLTGVGDEGEESDFGEGQTGGGSCQPARVPARDGAPVVQ